MLKIGEVSKLSHLTIKTLRYYEKEGLLVPMSVDEWTGYRMYETPQLECQITFQLSTVIRQLIKKI